MANSKTTSLELASTPNYGKGRKTDSGTRRLFRTGGFGLLALTALLSGCAASMPRPIETDTTLGRVVVYRNGVASFERRALVEGNRLTLDVPGERLDDFLKSLSVTDAKTGKLIPISYKTLDGGSDEAKIEIELPNKGPHDLRISYVTESPAWKPTYRLKLENKGKAKLESWAVVDNVSGEDWKHVAVGVGSTSALSFKYDLQSVRYVERETLHDNVALGVAPPTGGSPYAVAGKDVQVWGQIGLDAVEDLKRNKESPPMEAPVALNEEMSAAQGSMGAGTGRGAAYPSSAPAKPSARISGTHKSETNAMLSVANRLRASKQKVRIMGYARVDDADQRQGSMDRANLIRDELIAQGVAPDQVEAVGTGEVSKGDGARIVAAADGPAQAQQPTAALGATDEPTGNAYFLAKTPLTIEKDHSAMVSLLSTDISAKEVYYYDPISSRGSQKFAFRAVLIENPTDNTLDAGPFTVYSGDQFLGEGLSEPIPGKSSAFVPFALDRKLIVEPEVKTREQMDSLVTIERGILRSEARSIRHTELKLINRGSSVASVFVRHPISDGFKLEAPVKDVDKLRGAYLLKVDVPANGEHTLVIEESTPIQKTVDIRTDGGIAELGLYLKSSSNLDPELKQKLGQVIDMHRSMQEIQERITTVNTQMDAYRTRIDEINYQLVSLRKVTQAQELSRHLAKKMEEISTQLQKATMDVADLQGRLLTERVKLEDRLAELTLERRKEAVAGR